MYDFDRSRTVEDFINFSERYYTFDSTKKNPYPTSDNKQPPNNKQQQETNEKQQQPNQQASEGEVIALKDEDAQKLKEGVW